MYICRLSFTSFLCAREGNEATIWEFVTLFPPPLPCCYYWLLWGFYERGKRSMRNFQMMIRHFSHSSYSSYISQLTLSWGGCRKMFERNMLKYSRMIYATLSSFLRKKSLLSASKKKSFIEKIAQHFQLPIILKIGKKFMPIKRVHIMCYVQWWWRYTSINAVVVIILCVWWPTMCNFNTHMLDCMRKPSSSL